MPAPANDDYANASEITGDAGSASFTIDDATYETDVGFFATQDVWYLWTAPQDGVLRLDTFLSDLLEGVDPAFSLVNGFTGTVPTLAATDMTAFLNPTGDAHYAGVWFPVDEGVTYSLQVGTDGTSVTGTAVLRWSFALLDPQGVCWAPNDVTLDTSPQWIRLDDPDGYDVAQTWSIHRGRSGEMDKTGTGIASVTFKDTTGLLDPTNTGGAFYGLLDPMKQFTIALQHPVSGTWFPLFRGFLSSQDHDMDMWSDVRGIDTVTWEAADAFDLFGAILLTPGVHGDTTSLANFGDVYYNGTPGIPTQPDVFVHVDDHIVKLLDDAGWPGTGAFDTLRDIFSGNVSTQGKTYSRDQLLAALFDAADAEFPGVANVYMSKTGVVTFRGRFARFYPTNPGYGITTWEAGGMPEALADNTIAPIAGLQFRRSKEDIINSVLAMPQGADDSDIAGLITEDATSISTFGYRSETFTDLLTSAGHTDATPTTAAEETKKFAEYYVGNYKDPKTRVSVITFRPRAPEDPTAQALWDLVCGVEIGDRVHLQTTHVGGGGFDEMFYVEGIRYEARGARPEYHDITCELEVSPSSFFDYNPFGTVDGTP